MATSEPRAGQTLRAPLAGVSALLVFSLFFGASLNASGPAMQESRREAGERIAARQLTVTLARAVRQLVGSDQHKPCLHAAAHGPVSIAERASRPVRDERLVTPGVMLLRTSLIDLPPPALPIA